MLVRVYFVEFISTNRILTTSNCGLYFVTSKQNRRLLIKENNLMYAVLIYCTNVRRFLYVLRTSMYSYECLY